MTNNKAPALIIATALLLAACVGNAPAPETSPRTEPKTPAAGSTEMPNAGESARLADPAAILEQPDSNEQAENSRLYPNALDSHRLSTPENIPAIPERSTAAEGVATRTDEATDPYTEIPALIQTIFDYADTLYRAGYTDSATAYLERFRVIKPLWAQWETKADSMLNEFGKTRAEKAKAYEPMVFQIQNMNRANASYDLVAESADSLIALAPGDSLTHWARSQKEIAYNNTLAKAKRECDAVRTLADNQAQFAEAEKQAVTLQMRYRDFENELHTQALIDHIRELMQSADAEAAKYWESNEPAQALARADSLLQKEKFSEAKDILNKLKSSKLRKEANECYTRLANAYCTKQRMATSQLFTKAQKQKDPAKKKKLLQEAIAPLDKCLTEYPDNPQKQKVVENRLFLEKEANR